MNNKVRKKNTSQIRGSVNEGNQVLFTFIIVNLPAIKDKKKSEALTAIARLVKTNLDLYLTWYKNGKACNTSRLTQTLSRKQAGAKARPPARPQPRLY